jgi:hypothetical protein
MIVWGSSKIFDNHFRGRQRDRKRWPARCDLSQNNWNKVEILAIDSEKPRANGHSGTIPVDLDAAWFGEGAPF